MSHPLASPWTFYYYFQTKDAKDSKDSKEDPYIKSIKKIAKVETVEDFWAVYSHTIQPSNLKKNAALHFFRGDSRAVWEDPENSNGGTFFVKLIRGHSSQAWEKILLDFIRGYFNDDLIGAVVSVRIDNERLLLWNRTSESKELRLELVGQIFRSLGLPFKSKIEYLPHNSRATHTKPIAYILEADGPVEQPMKQ